MLNLRSHATADRCDLKKVTEEPHRSSCQRSPDLCPEPADFDFGQLIKTGATGNDRFRPNNMSNAIVQIGNCEGRGFVIGATPGQRYVVTAAHCLQRSGSRRPNLAFDPRDWTFSNVIGRLGTKRGTIWAELCMVNLTDDIAVFGEPHSEELAYEAHRYQQFTTIAIPAAPPPAAVEPHRRGDAAESKAWVLSLEGGWLPCSVYNNGRTLTLSGVEIKAGMSGSPLIDEDGSAIGFIPALQRNGDHNNTCPSLMDCLPGWLWKQLQPRD